MGRRALRKIDPRLDLSRYFHLLDELPEQQPLGNLFPRAAPLEVEVGSGKGLFMSTEPLQRPDRNFLGIEIARKYARFAAARIARTGVPNACMIHGDAEVLFRDLLTAHSVAAIHVYFPDPWWKKRHRKRRIVNPSFLRQADRTLCAGGEFHFWTDVEEYFREGLQVLAETLPDWSGPVAVAQRTPTHSLDYQTHFERRMRLHDKPIHRARFMKPGGS